MQGSAGQGSSVASFMLWSLGLGLVIPATLGTTLTTLTVFALPRCGHGLRQHLRRLGFTALDHERGGGDGDRGGDGDGAGAGGSVIAVVIVVVERGFGRSWTVMRGGGMAVIR